MIYVTYMCYIYVYDCSFGNLKVQATGGRTMVEGESRRRTKKTKRNKAEDGGGMGKRDMS